MRLRRTVLAGFLSAATAAGVAVPLAATPAAAATTIDGPDVSSYQHPYGAAINWAAVKKAGKEFAIVKATEGSSYANPYFVADYSGIRKAGMVRGSYHFARPALPVVATAVAQAKFYVHRLGATSSTSATLPPVLDLEVTGGLAQGQLITWAQDFLVTVRQLTGRTPMIYTYPYFWSTTLGDSAAFKRYPLWMASYSGGVQPGATLWQYTAAAKVSGIRGGVDMSRFLAPSTTWSTVSDGRIKTAWPARVPAAPIRVRGWAGTGSATVGWLPSDAGSARVTGYRVVASPGGASATVGGATTHATVTGLRNGVTYTFTVTATNSVGRSAASAPTGPVTPLVPTVLTPTTRAVVYGSGSTVSAVLRRPDTGAALAGKTVTVQRRIAGTTTWTPVGSFVTDANGRVSTALSPAPVRNTEVRFGYAAPAGWHSASAIGMVLVRPKVSAALSATTVRLNHTVWLTGKVSPVRAGQTVIRQGYYNGGWHTWATSTVSSTGAYSFKIVPTVRTTDVYRIVAAATAVRARGLSKTLYLTVR